MSGNLMPGLINQSMNGDMNNVEMVGIDTVTDAVSEMNNGLLHDVHLVQTKDIHMVPGESPMFVNFQDKPVDLKNLNVSYRESSTSVRN